MKNFRANNFPILVFCFLFVLFSGIRGDSKINPAKHGEFTGEILPVFYVRDVIKSVEFYRNNLGFKFNHYWDYENNKPLTEWKSKEKPVYAQMEAGSQKFAIHLFLKKEDLNSGGVIHYFEVKDVDAHYNWIQSRGFQPDSIYIRPWMRMFSVTDMDEHKIFFYTRPE